MRDLNLFFRTPLDGRYSIERVFSPLIPFFSNNFDIKIHNKPSTNSIFETISWANKKSGEINHITGDIHYISFGIPKKKSVLTIHDIGHFTEGLNGIKKSIYKNLWLKGPMNRVDIITTVSNFTKNQIIQYFNIDSSKIKVIYNSNPLGVLNIKNTRVNSKPVILQVGSGKTKNLNNLIKSVIGLNVKLLLINHLYDSISLELLKKYQIDFEQRINLSASELLEAYNDSDILFFASTYEGFGMPIIEAQSIGLPVITSNLASMPEVSGNASFIVDPYNIEQIRFAILSILNDSELRKNLIDFGFINVERFNVNTISKQYIDIYNSF